MEDVGKWVSGGKGRRDGPVVRRLGRWASGDGEGRRLAEPVTRDLGNVGGRNEEEHRRRWRAR